MAPRVPVVQEMNETSLDVFGNVVFKVVKSQDESLLEAQREVARAMKDPAFSGQAMTSSTSVRGMKSAEAKDKIWKLVKTNFSSKGMQVPSSADQLTMLALSSAGFTWWFSCSDGDGEDWIHMIEMSEEQPNKMGLVNSKGEPSCFCVAKAMKLGITTVESRKTCFYTGLPMPPNMLQTKKKISWKDGVIEVEIFLDLVSVKQGILFACKLLDEMLKNTNFPQSMSGTQSEIKEGIIASLENTGDVFFQKLVKDTSQGKTWEIKMYVDLNVTYNYTECCGCCTKSAVQYEEGKKMKASNSYSEPIFLLGCECGEGVKTCIETCGCSTAQVFRTANDDHGIPKSPVLHLRVLVISA